MACQYHTLRRLRTAYAGDVLVLPVLAMYAASLPGAEDNKALVGMAMGIYGLTQAFLQLPLGIASDKFGRKK